MADQIDIAATVANPARSGAQGSGDLTLLGTMHGPSVGHALLRHRGKVHRLEVGDTLDRATVTAIGEGVIIVSRQGSSERLRLPDS